MTDHIEDGGPAFPVVGALQHNQCNGITLRDYMAIHASDEDVRAQAEVIRLRSLCGILPDDWHIQARYMHADAMLKARKS